jgi:hypothetical protein
MKAFHRPLSYLVAALLACLTPLAAQPGGGAGGPEGEDAFADEAELPTIDAETRQVVEQALAWLVTQQEANGSWGKGAPGREQYRCAMTSYTLVALMAGGNLPGEGPHGRAVERGVDYLLGSVLPDGQLRTDNQRHYMYSHGITTLVLAEVYGETLNPDIRPKLEKMVDVILKAQATNGGWRYKPRPSGADISATVVQAVALRAARNSGLEVPQDVFERAKDYIRSCQSDGSAGFDYQPGQNRPGFARTAAAIYTMQVLGEYEEPFIIPASDYCFENFGRGGWFAYGNYYAAPAHYMIGGERWKRWYELVRDDLIGRVNRQGEYAYWGNIGVGVGRADNGPIYQTAVYTTILAMPLNYLPLYQR